MFSGEDPTIAIILYIDDFGICSLLGTSRKKHKVTAVYWVIADIPAQLRSSLTSIFLAILCKADDVKRFGCSTVLEPLLKDLVSLEEEGLYVPALGGKVKGTVFSIVADNLGAHSVGGFVENFSSSYFCRFCLADQSVSGGRSKNRCISTQKNRTASNAHPECAGEPCFDTCLWSQETVCTYRESEVLQCFDRIPT